MAGDVDVRARRGVVGGGRGGLRGPRGVRGRRHHVPAAARARGLRPRPHGDLAQRARAHRHLYTGNRQLSISSSMNNDFIIYYQKGFNNSV